MGIARDTSPPKRGPFDLPRRGTRDWPWWGWVLAIWATTAAALIYDRWGGIHWFALGDTDDNMRMMQVRAWLHGQGWYDLRNYRLDPPGGASIHWSRLVDLPIAAIMLVVRPFFGWIVAEKSAAAIAPVLPLAVAMIGVSLSARRLVTPGAGFLAAILLLCGQNAMAMWTPLRIDHHGWQLAFLALTLAGSADRERARGGIVMGLSTALSIVIGLEMLPYLGVAGGIVVLRWVHDAEERTRMRAYAVSLTAGCTAGFLGFASYDNRAPVCDALSPVWLSVALVSGALLVGLSALRRGGWRVRLALAVIAAAIIAAFYAVAWPHCMGRLEGVSPELDRLWLVNVREAKPLYSHGWRVALPTASLPAAGLIGALWSAWRARGTDLFAPWVTVALMTAFACGMLLWQTRAGPAAQLLAVPGATALAWALVPRLAVGRSLPVMAVGGAAAFLILSGLATNMIVDAIPQVPQNKARKAISLANRRCPTLPALAPIARLPKATILTFVDFGPRLITVTHHDAIAGPYHRNQAAILDVQHAFRGSPEVAHDVMRRHGATLLLICPGMSESTIYASQAKQGFYAQLRDGRVPGWLVAVGLPKGSPFKLWRLVG